jgi:hypothetical protein
MIGLITQLASRHSKPLRRLHSQTIADIQWRNTGFSAATTTTHTTDS